MEVIELAVPEMNITKFLGYPYPYNQLLLLHSGPVVYPPPCVDYKSIVRIGREHRENIRLILAYEFFRIFPEILILT